MKLIDYLKSNPSHFLALVISMVSISIIVMIIIVIMKLERESKVTKAALEIRKIANNIRAGLVHFVVEEDFKILYASRGFYELLGYTKAEAKAETKIKLIDFIYHSDIELFNQNELLKNNIINCDVRMVTKTGDILYVLINGNSVLSKEKKHTISAVIVDISEQKQLQERIILEGERYRIATELSKDVLFEYDIKSDELVHTEKYKDLYGRNAKVSDYKNHCEKRRDNIHPDDWGIYLEFCEQLSEGKSKIEVEFRLKDALGEFVWCQAMGKTIYDDQKNPLRVIGKIVNIDLYKRELEALEYKATRDPLTGVYNKEITIKKIERYISGNKNNKHILMFIDFDDFKKINDTYGHLRGDKVLIYVVNRIKELFAEGEIIGRIGGDEFVIFAGNVNDVEEVLIRAKNLISALDTIYMVDEYKIPISGSIGIATYPEDGIHYEQLMECADKALYRVKEQGKNNFMMYQTTI